MDKKKIIKWRYIFSDGVSSGEFRSAAKGLEHFERAYVQTALTHKKDEEMALVYGEVEDD
ncbi:MAG TPA: hypothetical protein VEP90_07225 [Methylomirabilota bacterium]|nr:hypothetical protein [Methylomirabilota bacterium]